MRAPFSEFSFGYAYTREIESLWKDYLIEAPEFPSLVREGEKGYDARLHTEGFIYCAQFKRSEYMVRSSAYESRLGYSPLPYYRFPIYGRYRSNQHELLCNLENPPYVLVEYVAPLFIDQETLHDLFGRSDLRNQVIRVKPSAIGTLPDDDDHSVVCDGNGNQRMLFSEPVELESPSDWGEITERGFESPDTGLYTAGQPSAPGAGVAEVAAEDVRTFEPQTIGAQLEEFNDKVLFAMRESRFFFNLGEITELDLVGKAQAVARILLGAELFVFQTDLHR